MLTLKIFAVILLLVYAGKMLSKLASFALGVAVLLQCIGDALITYGNGGTKSRTKTIAAVVPVTFYGPSMPLGPGPKIDENM